MVVVDLEDDELVFHPERAEESMPVVEMENGEAPQTIETVLP